MIVKITFLTNGKIILSIMLILLAPSIFAASVYVIGILLKAARNIKKYIPKKFAFITHIPYMWLYKPNCFESVISAGKLPTIGIVITIITINSIIFDNLYLNLAHK